MFLSQSSLLSYLIWQGVSVSTEEVSPSKLSTLSSFFLSFLPTVYSSNDGSSRPRRPVSIRSLPRRWKMNSFSLKNKPLDVSTDSRTETESDSADESPKENKNHVPQSNSNGCHGVEAPTSYDSRQVLSCLTEKSTFISEDLFEFLRSCLPNIVKGCKWILLYR